MARYKMLNGKRVQLTAEEETARDLEEQSWIDTKAEKQLEQIKSLRLQRLQETDWMANSDVTISEAWKTKRQAWRDIPQNNTTEEQYDSLLATDENGNLTNTIWSDA